ncbi:hypothetical protein ACQKLP_08260 [Chitinophaga sp. NPDC101104]|uniref:hypothetical protein n=1 Tax=Chitinophaga sp. NPDC101104 TaxID=3390561 RepID=UPI003CFC1965
MKSLKISFIAIVGVLAIGATIAAQAGVFTAKKALAETSCFRTAASSQIQIKTADCVTTRNLVLSTPCSQVAVNQPIFALNTSLFTNNPQLDCDGGNFFCCLEIAKVNPANPTQQLCSGQPVIDFGAATDYTYKVAQVFCKSTSN